MHPNYLDDKSLWFREIIARIIERDESALAEFQDVYERMIIATSESISHDHDMANEVVNVVLAKVWYFPEKIRHFGNPDGWVYRVTKNTTKDMLPRHKFVPLPLNIVSAYDEIEKMIDEEAYAYRIKDLSEFEKQIATYKIIQNYTFKEIAEILHRPKDTISSAYYRLLLKLQKK